MGHLHREGAEFAAVLGGAQEQLARIAEISSAIIYVLDAGGMFLWLNRGAYDLLGFKPADLLGRHFSTIMTDEEYEKVGREKVLLRFRGKKTGDSHAPRLFDERRGGGRRTREMIVRLLSREKGEQRIFKGEVCGVMTSQGYFLNSGENAADDGEMVFAGSQGIIFDVTEAQEAETRRCELERHYYETQKFEAIGRLAGGAAHHFNNKLGTILGYSELARQKYGAGNGELDQYLTNIIGATARIADLTSQLLSFSLQGTYQRTTIDVNKVFVSVSNAVPATTTKPIVVTLRLDTSNPRMIGDVSQIQSAAMHVVMNACDALGDAGGTLTLETAVVDLPAQLLERCPLADVSVPFVRCRVADNGVGMDASVRERMFDPFFTTKQQGDGVGLGLACVRGCVEKHGGVIDVASTSAQGTRFDIYFPLCVEEPGGGGEDEACAVFGAAPVVLVLDDDADMRTVLGDMLTDLGYAVTVHDDPAALLEVVKKDPSRVDCLILDCVLPSSGRIALCKEVLAVNASLAVVITTGYLADQHIRELLGWDRCSIVHKPFEMSVLARVVKSAILERRST